MGRLQKFDQRKYDPLQWLANRLGIERHGVVMYGIVHTMSTAGMYYVLRKRRDREGFENAVLYALAYISADIVVTQQRLEEVSESDA